MSSLQALEKSVAKEVRSCSRLPRQLPSKRACLPPASIDKRLLNPSSFATWCVQTKKEASELKHAEKSLHAAEKDLAKGEKVRRPRFSSIASNSLLTQSPHRIFGSARAQGRVS